LDASALSGVNDPKAAQTKPYLVTYDTVTTNQVDTFTFQTVAGTPVGYDIWLTYEDYPNRYVFWIGDGAINQGINSASFDLHPTPAL
jgi:hypothetical protein